MKRLVCVVEGKGDVQAVPALCAKILNYLEAWTWVVDADPVRQPRGKLVDEKTPSPKRPANTDGLSRAITVAKSRPADAVLVLCDSDDDCPAVWGPSGQKLLDGLTRGACVMAVREYEAWLLCAHVNAAKVGSRSIESIRNAKGELASHWPGYKPSVHQLAATRAIDVSKLRTLSPSFDKLVRSLAKVFGIDDKKTGGARR